MTDISKMHTSVTDDIIIQAVLDYPNYVSLPHNLVLTVEVLGNETFIVAEQQERIMKVSIKDFQQWIRGQHVHTQHVNINDLITTWIQKRPVTDGEAREIAVAVIRWDSQKNLTWKAVVVRGPNTCVWTPSALCSAQDIQDVQYNAQRLAQRVPVRMWVDGNVAIWRCDDKPALTSAVLCDIPRMIHQMKTQGLPTVNTRVVVSPPQAVACAPALAARRLASEVPEHHVIIAPEAFEGLRWT